LVNELPAFFGQRADSGVAIVESEHTAYLKVDQRLVDRKALHAIVAE
jgi:hypothetical protein